MCENQYAKFEYKGIKTFGVTHYKNKAPQKCCRWTERWDGMDPLVDLRFAKATEVKILTFDL